MRYFDFYGCQLQYVFTRSCKLSVDEERDLVVRRVQRTDACRSPCDTTTRRTSTCLPTRRGRRRRIPPAGRSCVENSWERKSSSNSESSWIAKLDGRTKRNGSWNGCARTRMRCRGGWMRYPWRSRNPDDDVRGLLLRRRRATRSTTDAAADDGTRASCRRRIAGFRLKTIVSGETWKRWKRGTGGSCQRRRR